MRRLLSIIITVAAVVQMAVGVLVLWRFLTARQNPPRRREDRARR